MYPSRVGTERDPICHCEANQTHDYKYYFVKYKEDAFVWVMDRLHNEMVIYSSSYSQVHLLLQQSSLHMGGQIYYAIELYEEQHLLKSKVVSR